jgi:hypothetical protein
MATDPVAVSVTVTGTETGTGFGDGHGGTYCNAEGNVIRDFVAANTSGAGMYMRGAVL